MLQLSAISDQPQLLEAYTLLLTAAACCVFPAAYCLFISDFPGRYSPEPAEGRRRLTPDF
jgi:hypothetical protein